jgi:allantoinase
MTHEWALRSNAVVTPDGIRPAAILVRGEQIAAVVEPDEVPAGMFIVDAGDKMVLPGLVDSHVHINEPGRTDWEGFVTATLAAAAGGVTTLIDMPLNSSPVTTTVAALNAKREAAAGKLWVDVGFHGGIVPGNAADVQPMIDAGVCAFKAFLCHSGIDEFPNAIEADLRAVMPIIAKAGLPLFVHAELVAPLPPEIEKAFEDNPKSYAAYLATRPPEWEVEAIKLMIRLCRETGCPVHIVHLAAARQAWPLIEAAKEEGLPFTVETCPHYLIFAAQDIPDGDPRYKCAPPIRSRRQRKLLRQLVREGNIDTIGSDHSPAPPGIKHLDDGNLREAWGGIASLQLLLYASWRAVRSEALDALTIRPATLVGLSHRKGHIASGLDADFVVFNPEPDDYQLIDASKLQHRHKATPYDGRELWGLVETTYLRGKPIYDRGEFIGEASGKTLDRS